MIEMDVIVTDTAGNAVWPETYLESRKSEL